MRVELLGHLGVGLEERLGGDEELEAAELLAQLRDAGQQGGLAARRALAELILAASRTGRRSRPRRSASRCRARPREVTRRTCSSPVRRPSRTTRLRRKPRCARRSQADSPWARHTRAPARGRRWSARRRAGSRRSARSRRSGRARGSRRRARRPGRAERVLELVAVAPLLDGGDDRLVLEALSLPIRSSASPTWAALTSSWRSYGSTCQGAPGWSAAGGMRSGDGSSTSTARASA